MSDSPGRIPQPTPVDELPAPEPPPGYDPPGPALFQAVQATGSGRLEFAVIYKRTHTFEPGGSCRPAREQQPLLTDPVPHEELVPEEPVSFRALSDIVGYKPGTDLVVNGSARPPRPLPEMTIGVQVGGRFRHHLEVFGRRVSDHVRGRIAFSDPEPFEEIPLRLETAYGGGDPWFERKVAEDVTSTADPEVVRTSAAAVENILAKGNPARYPRNRFGMGYVIDGHPEAIQGRELPHLELPDDRLTPERLVVENFLAWNRQPMPANLGVVDLSSFPRSAMLGLPPPTTRHPPPYPEVERGLLPEDFCRGNLVTTPPAKMPELVHPWAGRSAAPALWLPFLEGTEAVALDGMDPDHPRCTLRLPGERPYFQVRGLESRAVELETDLYMVDIEVSTRTVLLVWVARYGLRAPLTSERLAEIEADVRVGWRTRSAET